MRVIFAEKDVAGFMTSSRLVGHIDACRAASIALSYHERCDGAGRPHRSKGETIPLKRGIVAVLDALTSPRSCKPALEAGRMRDHRESNAGARFDPECVAALLALDARSASAS